jgi:hypothetical protein
VTVGSSPKARDVIKVAFGANDGYADGGLGEVALYAGTHLLQMGSIGPRSEEDVPSGEQFGRYGARGSAASYQTLRSIHPY